MKLNAGCGEDLVMGWLNVDVRVPRAVREGIGWEKVREDLWEGEHFGPNGEFYESYFRRLDLDEGLPWENGVFSRVRMDNVLEHLGDPLAVAREVHGVLEEGGRWVIIVPHVLSHRGLSSWDHKSFWTKDKLKWLARSQRGHEAHAARDLGFRLARFEWVFPSTFGGWLRGFPPMYAEFEKTGAGSSG